jgi:hypothetical protein
MKTTSQHCNHIPTVPDAPVLLDSVVPEVDVLQQIVAFHHRTGCQIRAVFAFSEHDHDTHNTSTTPTEQQAHRHTENHGIWIVHLVFTLCGDGACTHAKCEKCVSNSR